eukprot:TRINITY_DN82732_c0_g1_i1.p2 TRINITY_DN82732_c0_g1~~TRINITY_DN82732_c0_g1_i1.p2  ORF type:complete len:145 (-),score=19.63 TRINITY_DN82732_c0_g1_i1:3-437(-)
MVTNGSLMDMDLGGMKLSDLDAESLAAMIQMFKPMIDQVATGDVDGLAEQMGQMLGGMVPGGVDTSDLDFDMTPEERAEFEQMLPMFQAISDQLESRKCEKLKKRKKNKLGEKKERKKLQKCRKNQKKITNKGQQIEKNRQKKK